MNILSQNENLLERFSLLLQNSREFVVNTDTRADVNESAAQLNVRLTLLEQCPTGIPPSADGSCSGWVLLVSKKSLIEDQNILKIFADIFRLTMSQVSQT